MCDEGGFPGILWDEKDSDMTRPDDDEDDDNDVPLNLNVGYKAVDIIVDEHENGQSILDCFPHGDLHPQPFVEGDEGSIFVYS